MTEKQLKEIKARLEHLRTWIVDEGDILPYPPGESWEDPDMHWFDFLFSAALAHYQHKERREECHRLEAEWQKHRKTLEPDYDGDIDR